MKYIQHKGEQYHLNEKDRLPLTGLPENPDEDGNQQHSDFIEKTAPRAVFLCMNIFRDL